MVRLTLKLWDSISNFEARVWATHLFGGRLIPCFLLKFGSPNSKIVKTLYMITDPFKIFRICISWISSNQIWVADESHADNDFMEFVLHLVAWQSQHLMQKHRKWTAHLPLSTGCFLIAHAWFFYDAVLFWGIMFLNSIVPSLDFFLQNFLQIFIIYESGKGRYLQGFFSQVQNALSCNIF